MPSQKASAWNVNGRNANAVPLVPDKEVQMQSFRKLIQLLSQNMTNKNNAEFVTLLG